MYTDIVLDHFMHPRNVGDMPDADGPAGQAAADRLEAPPTLLQERRPDRSACHDLSAARVGHPKGDLHGPLERRFQSFPKGIARRDPGIDLDGTLPAKTG